MAATAAAALARRGRDDDRPLAPTSFTPVASPPPSFSPSSSSSTIALPRFLRREVPGDSFSSSANRTDRGVDRARAASPSETPRLRFCRDLRSARGRSSLSDSAVGDAGSGGWSSSESSGIRTTRFFLLDDIAGGAGPPPSPMSLRQPREILCTARARALTFPSNATPFKRDRTQQQPRATGDVSSPS